MSKEQDAEAIAILHAIDALKLNQYWKCECESCNLTRSDQVRAMAPLFARVSYMEKKRAQLKSILDSLDKE